MRPPSRRCSLLALATATATFAGVPLAHGQQPPPVVTPQGAVVEQWRAEIDGTGGTIQSTESIDEAFDLATLPDGSVVAVGRLRSDDDTGSGFRSHYDILAVRIDATDGAELGRFVGEGGDLRNDRADAVSVDSLGNIVIAGRIRRDQNGPSTFDAAVVKLDSSMTPLWTPDFFTKDGAPTDDDTDFFVAVDVDSSNDIVAAGQITSSVVEGTRDRDLLLCKIDGFLGTELWCAVEDGAADASLEGTNDTANAVAVDANDDVIVVGSRANAAAGPVLDVDMRVAKYAADGDGMSGPMLLWEQTISGTGGGADIGTSLAIDPTTGDVFAAGFVFESTTDTDLIVTRIDGATGMREWTQTIDGDQDAMGEPDFATALVIEPISGDVLVVGNLLTTADGTDAYLARLAASDGSIVWDGTTSGTLTNGIDFGRDVTLLSTGDIAVVGTLWNAHDNGGGASDESNSDASLIVFDPAGDGMGGALEKYRVDLLGLQASPPSGMLPHSRDALNAVVPASNGDVIVAGLIIRPSKNISGDNTNFLVSRIPEPAAGAAGGAALAGLALLRRRRAKG